MALVGADLGDAIKAAIDAVSDKTDRTAVMRAMGTAIVNYFIANAEVSATGTDPQGGLDNVVGGIS